MVISQNKKFFVVYTRFLMSYIPQMHRKHICAKKIDIRRYPEKTLEIFKIYILTGCYPFCKCSDYLVYYIHRVRNGTHPPKPVEHRIHLIFRTDALYSHLFSTDAALSSSSMPTISNPHTFPFLVGYRIQPHRFAEKMGKPLLPALLRALSERSDRRRNQHQRMEYR